MNQPHGLFDVDTFLTIFYDVVITKDEYEDGDLIGAAENLMNPYYESHNMESINLIDIVKYKDLLSINLLHEEIHYWQSMTSTVTIYNYLNIIKLLLSQAATLQFKNKITDTLPWRDNDVNVCMREYNSHRMNFNALKEGRQFFNEVYSLYEQSLNRGNNGTWKHYTRVLKDWIEKKSGMDIYEYIAKYLHMYRNYSYNVVSDNPPLAMPCIKLPHLESGKEFWGYLGVLDYFDPVYFTGDNLMESYAIVNEYISKGETIPEYDVSKGESNKYLGVYEVYRRMHAHRYSDERNLAISFLAIVDICFTTDMNANTKDYEFDTTGWNEIVSVPYRFGKLIFRAQGFRPFSNQDENELTKDIEKWQDDFCIYQGFSTPKNCIKHAIENLLFVLLNDFEETGYYFSDDFCQKLEKIWTDDSKWADDLEYVIKVLNEAYKRHTEKFPGICISFQNHMILSFVNALIYKLKNRGKVVLSSLFANEIRRSIEPAIYVIEGVYASNYFGVSMRSPLNDFIIGPHESIANMVLKNMAKTGVRSCGFKECFYPCRYIANGYGCPLVGLTQEERDKRKHVKMSEDWCHYKRIMNILSAKEDR